MDKRLKDIEDKTTAFKEMQAKVKKEMESVQESNSVINGGGESSNNNDQVPKVGVQTSQMQMMPTSIQMFLWESFDEDPSSMDDSSTITASGLLEQINVTRDTSDYLWYTTRKGFRYEHDTIVDGMIKDGLWNECL
ncbi:beta-galactosidase isoform X1 [Arachis hypogaea]|nr:beta-galactosidase isoform X1 [Arachis hypogaea]XP_025687543.1 beta-galactosidase isoform X1 [Arachis hypogaea]XP_025687544.1 beta-galactosidase isoform X1 [Arachis hypogaea]QHO56362.1 Beta-galactosidase [Arachis hypogaea]